MLEDVVVMVVVTKMVVRERRGLLEEAVVMVVVMKMMEVWWWGDPSLSLLSSKVCSNPVPPSFQGVIPACLSFLSGCDSSMSLLPFRV